MERVRRVPGTPEETVCWVLLRNWGLSQNWEQTKQKQRKAGCVDRSDCCGQKCQSEHRACLQTYCIILVDYLRGNIQKAIGNIR